MLYGGLIALPFFVSYATLISLTLFFLIFLAVLVVRLSQSPVCNGLTEGQRQRRILDEITASGVSSRQDIADDGSPQGRAVNWITNEDEAQLCPGDDNLIQRYIMAVFYYSTDGDRWAECSAGSASVRAEDDNDEEKEPAIVILEDNAARGDDDDDEQLARTGGGGNKNKGGQDNCLKYCRDKCCGGNGGDRLCNERNELDCRADCFIETKCDWKEAKDELEQARRKRDNDSDSRDRNNKNNKNDKRRKKNSKKGGRDDKSKERRLQVSFVFVLASEIIVAWDIENAYASDNHFSCPLILFISLLECPLWRFQQWLSWQEALPLGKLRV